MGETFLLTSGDKNELTAKIKGHFAAHEEELKKTHRIPSGGLTITRSHTLFVDSILSSLFKAISAEVSAGRDTALIALGGYGRGELNIRSDIDLMLLYKKGLTAEIEQLTQKMLYILWDAGLDVGFAIRKSGECIDLAREDSKTMTSFLDIRYLLGDNGLFTELEERVRKHLFTGKPLRNFIEEKLEEKKTRHEKYGGSVYILEPNVKEGEGGLRDIHTATWVVKAKNQGQFLPLETGLLTGAEIRSLEESGDFLHWVRNDLHFETRRKKDQLTFEHQERIAGLRGFVDKGHELAVEAFMQEYYRRASGIKNTSDLIISRCLRKKDAVFTFIRKKSKIDENFSTLGGLLTVAGDDVFTKNPPSIMKAFEYSQSFSVDMDRRTKDLILKNLEVIDDAFRSSPQAGKSFMNILNGEKVYETLLEMHTLKVLERYIPEFSAITCKVQHDLYHVYTVDIHSLFAIRELERLKTSYRGEFALLSDLFSEVKNPEILILAVLLHDIGKALGKGHAQKGAAVAPEICKRIGLTEDDTNLVTFLVKNHLLLADTAQYRDMHDEKLVIEFARTVADAGRLTLLYLLTFADVRAVGPEVWNQWKGTLFMELFFKGMTVLERGSFEAEEAGAKILRIKERVKELLNEEADAFAVENYFTLLPTRYFLANGPEAISAHIKIVRSLRGEPYVMNVTQVTEREYTELTVCTHDIHGLFAMISGVMAANSVNILGAQINTLKNGIALDIFQVESAFGELITDELKIKKIEKNLHEVISGKVKVAALVEKVKPSILDKKIKPKVPTYVEIDNTISDTFTVIDIHTQDRLGLLYRISSTLMNLGLYIYIAKIATKGGGAADIFYVKDIFGQKIYNKDALENIEDTLRSNLA